MIRMMENVATGHKIKVKEGFSWTTFFFGLFVPLLRGDLKWTLIMLALAFLTFGLSWLVMPFIYNAKYIESMQMKGYKFI